MTGQPSLFDAPAPAPYRFDGADLDHERDNARLTGQLLRIWNVVKDEAWHTLPELSRRTGDPEASISAQLRHLRKPRFGSHIVERRHVENGLYEYRVVVSQAVAS